MFLPISGNISTLLPDATQNQEINYNRKDIWSSSLVFHIPQVTYPLFLPDVISNAYIFMSFVSAYAFKRKEKKKLYS